MPSVYQPSCHVNNFLLTPMGLHHLEYLSEGLLNIFCLRNATSSSIVLAEAQSGGFWRGEQKHGSKNGSDFCGLQLTIGANLSFLYTFTHVFDKVFTLEFVHPFLSYVTGTAIAHLK